MKNISILLPILLVAWSAPGWAQTAPPASGATPAGSGRTEEYCEVQASGRLLSPLVTISVDFGQKQEGLFADTYKDAARQVVRFNSPIEALNFLNAQGWELMQVYVTGADGNSTHYLLRRRLK